jgi:hypothetical protein
MALAGSTAYTRRDARKRPQSDAAPQLRADLGRNPLRAIVFDAVIAVGQRKTALISMCKDLAKIP